MDARTKITVAYAIPVLCLGLSVVGAFAKILHIRVQRRRLDFMRTDETQRFKYLLLTIQKRKGGRVEDYRLSHINPPFVPLALGIFLMYVQIIYPGVARQVLSPYDCVRGEGRGVLRAHGRRGCHMTLACPILHPHRSPEPCPAVVRLAAATHAASCSVVCCRCSLCSQLKVSPSPLPPDPLTGEHFMESAPYIRCSPPSPAEVEARQSLLWGYGIRAEFDGDWRILQRYTWIMVSGRERARMPSNAPGHDPTSELPSHFAVAGGTLSHSPPPHRPTPRPCPAAPRPGGRHAAPDGVVLARGRVPGPAGPDVRVAQSPPQGPN